MPNNPISLRDGYVYLDGDKVLDLVSVDINFTPEVIERRVVGQRGVKRRYNGHDITGTITSYRRSPLLRSKIKYYLDTGKTPYFTITGADTDPDSVYVQENGDNVVTLLNAVLTGDLSLLQLDAEGDEYQDELEFGAESVEFG